MTRDINHLLKIAKNFDKAGLFSSSEVVDNLIGHIAGKLTNDDYRKFTKKIREGSVTTKKEKDDMAIKLLAIAAQFDVEGNFEESDKIAATVEAMLKKKRINNNVPVVR